MARAAENLGGGEGIEEGIMDKALEIENIEALRRSVGIDDVELRGAIRQLRAGDLVNLTLLASDMPAAGETLSVRITSIQGTAFRGKLVHRPTSLRLSHLRAGSPVSFTRDHIHSIPNGRLSHE